MGSKTQEAKVEAKIVKVVYLNSNSDLEPVNIDGRPVVDYHYAGGRVPSNVYYNYDTQRWERHDNWQGGDEAALPIIPPRGREYYIKMRRAGVPCGKALGLCWQYLVDAYNPNQSYPFNM